jgi:hypothetical protein
VAGAGSFRQFSSGERLADLTPSPYHRVREWPDLARRGTNMKTLKRFGSAMLALCLCAIAGPTYAANDLLKCKLIDIGDGSTDNPIFEIILESRGPDGPGGSMIEEGPMLLERQREIGEPHRWLGPLYKAERIDDLGIVAASDYNWGSKDRLEGSAFFYFDRRTGRAQLDEVLGADKKPDTEMGTCAQVKQ